MSCGCATEPQSGGAVQRQCVGWWFSFQVIKVHPIKIKIAIFTQKSSQQPTLFVSLYLDI
jgi:hypothetical protein